MPLARTSTRPRPRSRFLRLAGRLLYGLAFAEQARVGYAHIDQSLRQALHRVPLGQIGALQRLQRQQALAIPSPERLKANSIICPDCSPPSVQLRERSSCSTWRSPTLRAGDLDPSPMHRRVKAEVRHYRDGHAGARETAGAMQVQRDKRQQLVAVDDGAGPIDRKHPVAVTVEGKADIVRAAPHLLRAAHRCASSRNQR